jgi:hypothetical protein
MTGRSRPFVPVISFDGNATHRADRKRYSVGVVQDEVVDGGNFAYLGGVYGSGVPIFIGGVALRLSSKSFLIFIIAFVTHP